MYLSNVYINCEILNVNEALKAHGLDAGNFKLRFAPLDIHQVRYYFIITSLSRVLVEIHMIREGHLQDFPIFIIPPDTSHVYVNESGD